MHSDKKVIFKDVLAVFEDTIKKCSVVVAQDTIESIHDVFPLEYNENNSVIINGKERLYLFPGFIDPHVHFRTPGKEDAENWQSGSKAAVFAGVTTVLDMPNTNPSTVSFDSMEEKEKIIRKTSLINYGIIPGYTGDNMDFLKSTPAKAVKVYLASTTGNLLLQNHENLYRLNELNKKIIFHSENEERIQKRMKQIGMNSVADHSRIRDERSAWEKTKELLQKGNLDSKNIHIAHVSTKKEIDLLLASEISFEVSINHLFFSTKDYNKYGAKVKCNPPVRKKRTRNYLLKKLKKKKIPMIATDHAPHLLKEKESSTPPSGIPSIQYASHYILNSLSDDPVYASKILSQKAAETFDIKRRGKIERGYFADFALVDFNFSWEVKEYDILSACGWTPFINEAWNAKVIKTMVNGILYNTDELKREALPVKSLSKRLIYNVWND